MVGVGDRDCVGHGPVAREDEAILLDATGVNVRQVNVVQRRTIEGVAEDLDAARTDERDAAV